MGEAKRRGTYEERVAEGTIKRQEEELRQRQLHEERMAERKRQYEVAAARQKERDKLGTRTNRRFNSGMGRTHASVLLGSMMAYMAGAQRTPHKKDKGLKGGSCNREACQEPGAWWHNEGNDKYYCRDCAHLINRGATLCTNEEPRDGESD